MSTGVLLSYPAHGHLNASLAVASELVRRGQRILCAATVQYREAVEVGACEFVPYPAPEAEFYGSQTSTGLCNDMARLADLCERMLPDLLATLKGISPDFLMLDSKALWGNLAAQVLRLPSITLSSVFSIREELISLEALLSTLYGGAPKQAFYAGLNELARYFDSSRRIDQRYGTTSPGVVGFLGNPQALNIVFTCRSLQPRGEDFPDGYRFVGPALGPRPPAQPLPDFIMEGREALFISKGTVFNDTMEFYRSCFEAFADLPRPVVLAVGHNIDTGALGPVPANFVVRPFVPQLELLPKTALFVTHGGLNSVNEALLHGVPLVVSPEQGDQHFVAARVVDTGAGLLVPKQAASAAGLRAAVDQVLSEPSYRARARALSEEMHAGRGAAGTADAVLEFVARV